MKKRWYLSNYMVQRVWMQQHLRWHWQAAIAQPWIRAGAQPGSLCSIAVTDLEQKWLVEV